MACSFDYGDTGDSEKGKADIVMENIEYVRVRGGDPLVRFQAEYAERWEERQTMELKSFSFEQMEEQGDTINAEGKAGSAVVQLNSGDVALSGGVRINIESEDIIIITARLEWLDKEKILSGGEEDTVDIQRSDGTSFSGIGFFADARNRAWSFSGEVKGTYVETDDEDEESGETGADQIPAEWVREETILPAPERQPPREQAPREQAPQEQPLREQPPREQAPQEQPQSIPEPVQPQVLPDDALPQFIEEK